MMYRGSRFFGGGGFILILIVAVVIYFVIKYLNQSNNRSNIFKKDKSPLEILNERYAKGEIDEDEYKKKKRMLEDKV